jgi:hypothetical protein
MKFVVTINDPTRVKNRAYEGEYQVLPSGAVKITKSDGVIEHFSPSGWLWLAETGGD